MAQHDYSIANGTGINFRTDLNGVLQAIVTNNSGVAQPTVMYPGQFWLDMSGGGNGVIKRRNATNTAWVSDVGLDQTARDAAAAAQTTANAALPRTGGTMTGAIVLPNVVPNGHEAVSRAQADLLYSNPLPVTTAGALLVGTAAGWKNVLPAGVDASVLAVSGATPVWQATTTTTVPNAIVRTKSDGTLDASLIPAVAAGLKFCATFKPVVNNEYPTTGGHGAGGAPGIGDFYVIDGLTTGGYTYLTGSMAGVTVYNGDSIAYNGAGTWYRMGNTVAVSGYLKIDGSTAMTGALNMGSQSVTNVGGLTGRAGTPVLQTNFRIDGTNIVISPQRGTTGAALATMAAGQIGTDLGEMNLLVGTASVNQGMIPVRWHSTTATYAQNDIVANSSGGTKSLYRAKSSVATGTFNNLQWLEYMTFLGGTMESNANIRFRAGSGVVFEAYPTSLPGYEIDSTSTAPERLIFWTNDASGNHINEAISIERNSGLITLANDVKLFAGRLYGTALHNNASGLVGAANQYVGSGTYTPTVIAGTNCAGITAQPFQWMRVGNVVTVSGRLDTNATAAGGTATTAAMTLPIASAITNVSHVAGAGNVSSVPRAPVTISGDTANVRAALGWQAQATGSIATMISFTYLIL